MNKRKEDVVISRKKTVGNASYPYHRHNGCEIYLFLSGNVRVYIDESCFVPTPDSLVIFKPHQLHRIQSIDESVYERIVINLSQNYMNSFEDEKECLLTCFANSETGNFATLSFKKTTEFQSLCKKIERYSRSKEPSSIIRTKAYTELLLVLINEVFESKVQTFHDAMPETVVKIMKYIDSHLTEDLSFLQMSKDFGIPLTDLREEFKKHIGLTLREYLLERKIVIAKNMLKNGSSVTTACYDSGFNDYANFIRSFKKKEGITPGQYRKTSEDSF